MDNKRNNFTSSIGFIMAAAGSAVGLGNIWRFPYLAAKDGGGLFLVIYIILALTFGFALLTTEIAIGRRTAQGPLTAYGKVHKKWKFLGWLAWIVPVLILPYYCAIGGWVLKYFVVFVSGAGKTAAEDGFFGGYITSEVEPIVWFIIFLIATAIVVLKGVNDGIENVSKILMPILIVLILGISVFSITISKDGVTGLDGLKVYLIPDFTGLTFDKFLVILTDAMGQLFFSISVAMGIMVAYGSYAKKDANLMKSINRIEFFDTLVAMLAGLMIIPAVFVFFGREGMSKGGPGLMFQSLPKVFAEMGGAGTVIGIVFFLTVIFAAVTSSVSVMEAIVSGLMDKFNLSRRVSGLITTLYSLILGVIVCLGYNKLYFEVTLPNGSKGQILDVMDYISNSWLMPLVAFLTCILIGWVVKPDYVIDELVQGDNKFARRRIYKLMIKYIAPIMLFVLLLQSFGIIKL
ncbi:MAG: sodium-dependent transporter [Lachnospiraceae bacterium]|nr:sodium-dependent transporter [Lachnospiraceae bacterium]